MSDLHGFHGDVATSHLPEKIKRAILGYETNIRCGKIEFGPDGHPVYTEQEFSAMARVWAHGYINRHPLAADYTATAAVESREFRAEVHTLTPEQAAAHKSHLDHFLRMLGQAQGLNPEPITVPHV